MKSALTQYAGGGYLFYLANFSIKKSRLHAAFFLCVFCDLIHKLLRAHNAQFVQAQALSAGHHLRHRLVLGLGV